MKENERKQSELMNNMGRQQEEMDILRAEKQKALLENKQLMAAAERQKVNELVGGSLLV